MTQQRSIDVYLLPQLIRGEELRGRTVVVVDVLRATSTIVTALAHGAAEIIPSDSIDGARAAALARTPRALLGGERQGAKIPGFDLGNSPREYATDSIRGQSIVLATTNGTCAMSSCRDANEVLIGAFVNVSALAAAVESSTRIAVVCSGTDGLVTAEDALLAGCLVDRLGTDRDQWTWNDQAAMAAALWKATWQQTGYREALAEAMGTMHGGRNLVRRGMADDILFCATADQFANVPRLDLVGWSIR